MVSSIAASPVSLPVSPAAAARSQQRTIAKLAAAPASEIDRAFFELFPHRFDYIWAEHGAVGEKCQWQTESRHPLSDRMIQQGAYLYGVRFGAETRYCLLDIDTQSPYHPQSDPLAIGRILSALEPLNLVEPVRCQSSYSGGIHLYFPFETAQKTWSLAAALQTLLEAAGFKVAQGQLELFPNPKLYNQQGEPSLYAAHRLPMQIGSYLLDGQMQPIYGDRDRFVQHWQFAQARNSLRANLVQRVLKVSRRQRFGLSGKADKFLNDLNTEIETGWTGFGQTNYILGRIALRGYVFGQVLLGTTLPLTGRSLVDYIINVARSLPGYGDWCRHQPEIAQRAAEWATCVENSHYFPFGRSKVALEPIEPSWNQRQSASVRERIQQAIAHLLNQGSLAAGTTDRFKQLTQLGIGGGSLYRHRDLWHPEHLWKTPPHPPAASFMSSGDRCGAASPDQHLPNLFPPVDCNLSDGKASDDRNSDLSACTGRNFAKPQVVQPIADDLSDRVQAPAADPAEVEPASPIDDSPLLNDQPQDQPLTGLAFVRQVLQSIQSNRQARRSVRSNPEFDRDGSKSDESKCLQNHCPPADRAADLPTASVPNRSILKPDHPDDLSDLLAEILVRQRLLNWSAAEVQQRLQERFGVSHRSYLTESQLTQWLAWLIAQPQVDR